MQLKISASLPLYEVRHTGIAPALDGWLDSPPWRGAQWFDRFVSMDTAASAPKTTRAALLWDERCLYLGVVCDEPRLALLRADTRPGEAVGSDDCVELRLDAGVPGVELLKVWVNAAGTVAVSAHIIDNPGWGTSHPRPASGIKAAARFTATGWQVEVAITYASLRLSRPFPPALKIAPSPSSLTSPSSALSSRSFCTATRRRRSVPITCARCWA